MNTLTFYDYLVKKKFSPVEGILIGIDIKSDRQKFKFYRGFPIADFTLMS